jgi:class 3 adenylate cyclase
VFYIYPTSEFESEYKSNTPVITTLAVTTAFLLMGIAILAYDWFVRQQNKKVVGAAARTGAIVSSLFPSTVRDQLIEDYAEGPKTEGQNKWISQDEGLSERGENDLGSKPNAHFYPETTVMFADLVGFTSWSSVRPPEHVFIMLESLYRAYDDIAGRLGVYKVETIGDCYVAVTGLPDPQPKHAVIMVTFARDCQQRMKEIVPKLAFRLGPDTNNLSMRFGIHSGPVTAGVLRGDRARFQLFGDTVMAASKMESNGARDCIHVSQSTADLLMAGGKSSWLSLRSDLANSHAERTYWVSAKKLPKCGTETTVSETEIKNSRSFADIGPIPSETFTNENNSLRENLSCRAKRFGDNDTSEQYLLCQN